MAQVSSSGPCKTVMVYRNDKFGRFQTFYGIIGIPQGRGCIRRIPVYVFPNCVTMTVQTQSDRIPVLEGASIFELPLKEAVNLVRAGRIEVRKDLVRCVDGMEVMVCRGRR